MEAWDECLGAVVVGMGWEGKERQCGARGAEGKEPFTISRVRRVLTVSSFSARK